jgi:nucleoside-diphosphate-sugar epimerase
MKSPLRGQNPDRSEPVCAITGSTGYVGGCVKAFFREHGWDILELIRRPTLGDNSAVFNLGNRIPPEMLARVDALIHCAYDFEPLYWNEIHAVNVQGSEKILKAAKAAGVGRIIYISSISAYQGCRSLYGRAKLEIEKIALDSGALVIRPGLVYGSRVGGMFGKLAEQVRKSPVLPICGNGAQIQFLIHHDDFSEFCERYARGAIPVYPAVFTAAHEKPWPLRELLLEIAHAQNKQIRFVCVPWRSVWAALKFAEIFGWRVPFRSDNLLSFIYQNQEPDFSANSAVGLVCRPFTLRHISREP